MKILVACEYSGRVRDAFIRKGHNAISCDLLDTESPGPHYLGDVRDILYDGWDMMICHPPCTYNTNAQSWAMSHPDDLHLPYWERRPHPKYPDRRQKQIESIAFVKTLISAPIPKIGLENPVPMSVIIDAIGPYTQTVQPYMFGEDASKRTCLWLRGLPPPSAYKLD